MTAVLENVNKFSYLGLRRRPTYNEVIGLIKENEALANPLPNRDATFFKASNEGSFFDGLDHLEVLKEQQQRILQRQVQDLLLRQNVRQNGGTYHLERHRQQSSSDTSSSITPMEGEGRETLSAGLQADLQRREARLRDRQQQTGEAQAQELSRQSRLPVLQGFISESLTPIFNMIPSPAGGSVFPVLPIPSRQVEQEEEEELIPDEEMLTAREEAPKKKSKLMKDISYSTNISRWNEQQLDFQLFIRGIDTRDPEVSIEGLRKKGKGKGITNWQYLNNLANQMINDGRWERKVNEELLKKRIKEYNQRQKPRGSRD